MYLRTVPGKKLFASTLIHEVVNRGDIFAVRLRDHCLTIIPGGSEVSHLELEISAPILPPKQLDLDLPIA